MKSGFLDGQIASKWRWNQSIKSDSTQVYLWRTSRSTMLSTAIFEAAHARIFDPRFTSCKIISTTVVVFPVPGGPCNKNTFFDARAFEIAAFCRKKKVWCLRQWKVKHKSSTALHVYIYINKDAHIDIWNTHKYTESITIGS